MKISGNLRKPDESFRHGWPAYIVPNYGLIGLHPAERCLPSKVSRRSRYAALLGPITLPEGRRSPGRQPSGDEM